MGLLVRYTISATDFKVHPGLFEALSTDLKEYKTKEMDLVMRNEMLQSENR